VSCIAVSIPALANITPVTPPNVNNFINPTEKVRGVLKFNKPSHIVPNQLKTLIPVGTAITIVADVKYDLVSMSKPTVNMW